MIGFAREGFVDVVLCFVECESDTMTSLFSFLTSVGGSGFVSVALFEGEGGGEGIGNQTKVGIFVPLVRQFTGEVGIVVAEFGRMNAGECELTCALLW